MRRTILPVIALCLAALAQVAAAKAPAQDYSLFEKHDYKKDGYTLLYRIIYPEDMKQGEKYPLFLFLHGLGMRGVDNTSQLDRGAFLFVNEQNRKQYPCIALYPQVPATKGGSFFWVYDKDGQQATGTFAEYTRIAEAQKIKPEVKISPYGTMVMDLVNELIARGIVDTKRIYISGSSMGGYSTFQFITAYPDLFAAAGPIASSMNPDDTTPWLGKVPIWIFHGDGDRPQTLKANPVLVERMKAAGFTDFKYTVYPNTGHNSWDKAFAEPDYLKWFFEHSKK